MRYVEFRDAIQSGLRQNPEGLTWVELKDLLDLPYRQPCPEWVQWLERDIGLTRARGSGRAYLWKAPADESVRG
jgi:hypothetical protein